MSVLSEEIEKRVALLKQQIRVLEAAVAAGPAGRLRVSCSGQYVRLYEMTQSGDVTGRYIRRSEQALAKELAQKEYHEIVLISLRKELNLLQTLDSFYHSADLSGNKAHFFYGPEELIWDDSGEVRKSLVTPIALDDETFVKQWLAVDYDRKGFYKDAPEYYTSGGIRVRSKTELIIAEMLDKCGIPFHYERPIRVKKLGTIHPDFTVLNIKKRKTFYWEHMGMMDDVEYRTNALHRINCYIQDGYLPGENLILTHETSRSPVQSKTLKKVIETYLLS